MIGRSVGLWQWQWQRTRGKKGKHMGRPIGKHGRAICARDLRTAACQHRDCAALEASVVFAIVSLSRPLQALSKVAVL